MIDKPPPGMSRCTRGYLVAAPMQVMTTVTTVAADVAPVVMKVAIIGAQVTAFPAGSGHVAVVQVPAERAPVPAAIVPVFVEVVPVVAHVARIPSDIMPHGVGKARDCLRERKGRNGQSGWSRKRPALFVMDVRNGVIERFVNAPAAC